MNRSVRGRRGDGATRLAARLRVVGARAATAVGWALLGVAWATVAPVPGASPPRLADVVSVQVDGEPGVYRFSVGIESPDTGCDRYADWWEVVTPDGRLVHRRVLAHSHVQEQPFVRSGGPVEIDADTVVRVRAHLHPGGYGGVAWEGSVRAGFQPLEELPATFAPDLARVEPRPPPCAH